MTKSPPTRLQILGTPTTLSIGANPVTGSIPLNVTLEGFLKDDLGNGKGGRTIDIYLDNVNVGGAITMPEVPPLAGYWWLVVTITNVGAHTVYAKFLGDEELEGAKSTTITVVATEVPPTTYSLTVNSTPSGITFTLDATSHTTPYTETLAEGTHTITMPQTVTINSTTYTFKQWEDGSTSATKTINLTIDLSITATYEAGAPPPNLLLILGLIVGVVAVTAVAAYYS